MRTTSTKPDPTHLPTQSVCKQVIEGDSTMKYVPFSQADQLLQVVRRQDVHIVHIERLLKIIIYRPQESLSNKFVRDRLLNIPLSLTNAIRMVWRILHETIHNMIPLRAERSIQHTRNSQI